MVKSAVMILGVLAAGKSVTGFSSPAAAMHAMARAGKGVPGREPRVVRPNRAAAKVYDAIYPRYRKLAEELAKK